MRFEWNEDQNRQNLSKHDVRFETAVLVFDDPYAITQRDFNFEAEERWITIGAIGAGSVLLVVHTFGEESNEEVIRIISARAAERHERKAYEETYERTKNETSPQSRQKKTRTLTFPMLRQLWIGAERKSGSSTGRRRSPSPCAWIPTSLNG